jgi:hypothetical protein
LAAAALGDVDGVCEQASLYARTPPAVVMKRGFFHLLKILRALIPIEIPRFWTAATSIPGGVDQEILKEVVMIACKKRATVLVLV